MKKFLLSLLALLLIVTTALPSANVFAQQAQRVSFSDAYLDVSMDKRNGRFAVRTTGGDPLKPGDDHMPVLYEKEIPETSFASFVINGDYVIFGNSYLESSFVQPLTVEGNRATAVWKYKDVEITQIVELIGVDPELSMGNARISYQIRNTGDKGVEIGTRLLFDTATGGKDGAYLMRAGEPFFLRGEREFIGEEVPLYWTAVDDPEQPTAASYGLLYGWGEKKPDRVVFGHWSGLSSTIWEYEIDEWIDYTTDDNIYGSADSAVAIYWDRISIAPGSELSYTSFVGMGDLASRHKTAGQLGINFTTPNRLMLEHGVFTRFEVTAELDNALPESVDQRNLRVEIAYPNSIRLIEGETSMTLAGLAKGERMPLSWTFEPNRLDSVNVYTFTILVKKDEEELVRKSAYVVALPQFDGELPEIEYTSVTPNRLYYGEIAPKVQITGHNLNYLRDDPDKWSVYVTKPDGTRIEVEKDGVEVLSNQLISVYLPEGLGIGAYGIGIEHQLEGRGFYRENAFEYTNDSRLAQRAFGSLLITKVETVVFDFMNQEYTHVRNRIHHQVGSAHIPVPAGETEVLRITGNIQKIGDTFSIIPTEQNAIFFGKLLKIDSVPAKPGGKRPELTVSFEEVPLMADPYEVTNPPGYEMQRQAVIEGNDLLRIHLETPTLKLGHRVIPAPARKPQIWNGEFNLNVNDFVIKKPNLLGLASDMATNIGGFTLGVKELRYGFVPEEGKYAVDIKAGLDLGGVLGFIHEKFGTKKQLRSLAYVDAQAEKFRILEDGTIKFKTEFAVGLPHMTIGPLTSVTGGPNKIASTYGKLSIDTIDNLYSIEAQLAIPDLSSFEAADTNKKTTAKLQGKIGVFAFDTPNGMMFLPDTVEVKFQDNFGFISIPQIPFAINQIGGGIYNLHTLRDASPDKYPDFGGYFLFGITDTFSPIFFGKRMLSFQDVTLRLSSREFGIKGQGYIYFIPLLEGEAKIMYYPKLGVYASGGVNIGDVIIGKAAMETSYNFERNRFYAGGYVYGVIQIPNKSPIFPGAKLAEAQAGITTDEVRAFAAIPIINIYAGVRYRWTTGYPEFFTSGEIQLPDMPFSVMTLSDPYDPVEDGGMVIGTNFTPIAMQKSSSAGSGGAGIMTLSSLDIMGAGDQTVTGSVYYETEFYSDGMNSVLIQTKVPKDAELFPLKLTDPNGSEIHYPTYLPDTVLKSVYEADDGSILDYYAFAISPEDNRAGKWIITSPIDADFEGFSVLSLSVIDGVVAKQRDDDDLTFDVTVSLDSPPAPGLRNTLDLYLEKPVKPGGNSKGDAAEDPLEDVEITDFFTILAEGIEIDSTDSSAVISVELPETVESGEYVIRAALRQYDSVGNEMQFHSATSDTFTFENPKEPAAPAVVTAETIGNGQIRVTWNEVEKAPGAKEDILGYFVTVFDENGDPLEGAEPVWVDASEGGPDGYSAVISGYAPGKEYVVAVQAVSGSGGNIDPDDGAERIISGNSWIIPAGFGYSVATWEIIDGIEEYELRITGGPEEIIIPYYDDGSAGHRVHEFFSGKTINVIDLPLKNLPQGYDYDYDLEVYGVLPIDLNAKNIEVTALTPTEKKIEWDAVDMKNIVSYTIVAVPEDESDAEIIVYEHKQVTDPQPGRYDVTLDGFAKDMSYSFTITANQADHEAAKKYYSAWKNAAAVFLPEPNPPEFRISVRAQDVEGRATVQMLQENGFETFLINSREVTINFTSDDAVRAELYVNADPVMSEEPFGTYHESVWSEMVRLEEGLNEVRILAYNAEHDLTVRTYYIAVKTSLPTLMVDTSLTGEELTIAGFTDSGTSLYINSTQIPVGDDGAFTYTEPANGRFSAEFMITALDLYGNENTYIGEAVRTDMGAIHGVEIVLERDEMAIGEAQKLRLYARDEQDRLTQLPDEAVTWSVIQDEEAPSAEIAGNGYLTALRAGQIVVTAAMQVNENFVWQDAAVVEIDPERDPAAMFHAYLTNVIISGGGGSSFDPAFDPDIREYRLSVPYAIEEINLRPQTDLEQIDTIEINGEIVSNGDTSSNIPLVVGENTIEVKVTGHGLFDNLYTFTVIRAESNDPDPIDPGPTDPYPVNPDPIGPDPGTGPDDEPSAPGTSDPDPEQVEPVDLEILTKLLPEVIVRQFASLPIELTAASGTPPYTFAVTNGELPVGMKLNGTSGVISGVPLSVGNYRFTVTVTDRDGRTASQNFTLRVVVEPVVLKDIAGHWAEESIRKLVSTGAITGYPDGTFRPDNRMTRSEFITVLVRAFGLENAGSSSGFSDTANHWAREFIDTAASLGIVNGYPDGRFGPDEEITREQMAVMLVKAAQLDTSAYSGELPFTDRDNISSWAASAVAAAVANGLIKGYPDGTFRPQQLATRAEAATVLALLD